MNILFLSTRSPYPLISGHSLRTYHILKGAAKRHNVTLLTFVQLPEHELREENLEHLRGFCKAVHAFKIPIDSSATKLAATVLSNIFLSLPFVAQKYDVPAMREKIREVISSEKIDLVHVDMLPLTVYLDEFAGIPKVLVNHNVESVRLYRWFQTEPNLLKKAYLGMQYPKLRSFELEAMGKFDSCMVVSGKDKEILEEMGVKNRIVVVPNGTDTTFFKPLGRKLRGNSVLWLGHMDVHTNKDAVLHFWRDMYPLLCRQYPAVDVTFVGTAPPREIVEATRSDRRVRVTGFVGDVRPYIDEAAVIIVPIRIGSGTRLKILDSMGMGKAIVSSSVGCEGLDVTDGEDILIADNPEEFTSKVVRVLTDEGLRMKLQEKALGLALKYDWRHICEIQEQVYEQVTNRNVIPG